MAEISDAIAMIKKAESDAEQLITDSEAKSKDLIAESVYTFMYKRYIDWNEAKLRLRDKVTQTINKKTKKNPIVIVTIVDINNKL